MRRLAVVVSGWHFPYHFYKRISEQKIPDGWSVDLFCISHRDPSYSREEKNDFLASLGNTRRDLYDRILYEKIASVKDIESLGWHYELEPNTIGDWGNTNQWLAKNDYKEYDRFLFSHDDNFILTDEIFLNLLSKDDWLIITNSVGNTQRRLRRWLYLPKPLTIRGSFEFFTKEMIDIMGGFFDLSQVKLNREGKFTGGGEFYAELNDWNSTVVPLRRLIKKYHIENRVKVLSKYYRMSVYCLEGERGYISKTDHLNTKEEEKGLDIVERYYSEKINSKRKKVLYLFNGKRSGLIDEIKAGDRPDDGFYGMYRLRNYDINANYAEVEDVFPLWFAAFLRKHININYIHIPIIWKLFKSDIIFSSSSFGAEIIHAFIKPEHSKWVIYDFSLTGLIGNMKTLKQKIFRWMVKRAGGIITLSRKEADILKENFPNLREHIEFIPLGVDLKFFRPQDDVEESNQIISVGLDPNRDYNTLFKAAAGIDVEVLITCSRRIEFMRSNLPDKVKTAYFSWKELVREYAKSKIVVLPLDIKNGINDASGCTSLVEAMAMGKAIIATRTPTTESYIINSENGVLVECGDIQGMNKAILNLLADKQKRDYLGENARAFVEKNCDADKSANKMAKFFLRITQGYDAK